MIRKVITYIFVFLVMLVAGQGEIHAQQKSKSSAPAKTSQTNKKTTTQNKKTTQSKSGPTQKKTGSTQSKKPSGKSSTGSKSGSKSNSASTKAPDKPAKKLSRAEYEKQQRDLQKQIAATEQMISDNDKSVLSQSRDIKLREDEISKRKALLVAMSLELESIKQEEDSLKDVIARLKKEYGGKQDKYAKAVRHMYKWRSGYDEWLFVMSATDFSESLRRVRYLHQYSRWRQQEAHLLAQQRMAAESVQEKLVLTRQDREQVFGNLQKEKDVLARKQKVQEDALSNLKKRQKELKNALAADKKKQQEIQKQISRLIEEERKAAAKKNQSSSSGKENSSPEVRQLTGSFRQNKGKMPYPVDSNFSILSHYSKDGNYSITISTTIGAHCCAVFDGTVSKVVRTSEDWTILINHGDYTTVYSGLGVCHVKEGQKIKMRQSLGVIKSDVEGRRAELMFWIYGKSDAENPEAWLKK